MTSVMVFVKRSGILVPCKPCPTPDGAFWRCAHCNEILMRASFGVLNGMVRCFCGSEVELLVGGRPVDIEELNVLNREQEPTPEPPTGEFDEAEFLRECGIAISEEEKIQ